MTSSNEASGVRDMRGERTGYWSLRDSSQMGTGVETGTRGGKTGTRVRGEG